MSGPFRFERDGQTYFVETPDPAIGGIGAVLEIETILYERADGPQHVLVFYNPVFGHVLAIDGVVQLTEGDHAIYHEAIVHTPLFAHGGARSVLIIGGGDGGVARQVLRHESVERAVMVEIDADVIAFSRKWLASVSQGAFDDPRLEVVIDDGAKFVAADGERFDAVIIDLSDPVGPSAALFTTSFYKHCKARLNEGGVLVAQSGLYFGRVEALRKTEQGLRQFFKHVHVYQATIPSYTGGPLAFMMMSDAPLYYTEREVLERRFNAAGLGMTYYMPAIHQYSFIAGGLN